MYLPLSHDTFSIHSLAAGRFEYAHALGVTGAGQIIAVRDSGFDVSHAEFRDKYISFANNIDPSAITVGDHGTAVAALAAGSADHGRTIGAAPDAALLLSSWTDQTNDALAVRAAEDYGAIVMNNSWGIECPGDPFDECGVNDYSMYSVPRAMRAALLDYAGDEGIVVFSASNEETQTQATLYAALPMLMPALEDGWLTVINLARDFDANLSDHFVDNASGVALMSSGCLEAARWCIAADGTAFIASSSSRTGYELGTGTSYAAPRVSGAIAVLAHAFPNLSAPELRNRLLVTADNEFFTPGDPLIQTMSFADGITHDYHRTYGHGFVDVRAALLPIGTLSTRSTSGTTVALDAPLLTASAGVGDAVQKSLNGVLLATSDQLGGQFASDASHLTASSHSDRSHLASLGTLPGRDLTTERNGVSRIIGSHALFDDDRHISLRIAPDFSLDTRLPAYDTDTFGARLAYRQNSVFGDVTLGISHLEAGVNPIGLSHVGEHRIGSSNTAIHLDWTAELDDRSSLHLSANSGVSRPHNGHEIAQLSDC